MTARPPFWCWLLLACILLRLPAMAWLPLIDTSEPRYADIARLMLAKNDWITLWFNPELPFWGKPPLAFWSQALSMRLFGIHEFALRLPGWLATLATAALTWRVAWRLHGPVIAGFAALIFTTMGLSYLAGAAVLTDPFLTLGTTLSLSGFLMADRNTARAWQVAIFAGVAVSLLSKGPIGLVITATPVLVTALFHGEFRKRLRDLPWVWGIVGILATTLPWYVAAEMKTPGFLRYFIIGEHVMRFLDSGWQGDLYGSAHDEPRGTTWIHGLKATFPWGVILLLLIVHHLWHARRDLQGLRFWNDSRFFLTSWALTCGVFFTPAGNVLWTYWMPSLPAIAILAAQLVSPLLARRRLITALLSLSVPVMACGMLLIAHVHPEKIKTEKYVLEHARQLMRPGDAIVYVHTAPFSAKFYSGGALKEAGKADLAEVLPDIPGRSLLVVTHRASREIEANTGQTLHAVSRSRDYQLFVIERESPLWRSLVAPDLWSKR